MGFLNNIYAGAAPAPDPVSVGTLTPTTAFRDTYKIITVQRNVANIWAADGGVPFVDCYNLVSSFSRIRATTVGTLPALKITDADTCYLNLSFIETDTAIETADWGNANPSGLPLITNLINTDVGVDAALVPMEVIYTNKDIYDTNGVLVYPKNTDDYIFPLIWQ